MKKSVIGAVVISGVGIGVAAAIVPLIAGVLAASVAYGRAPSSQTVAA